MPWVQITVDPALYIIRQMTPLGSFGPPPERRRGFRDLTKLDVVDARKFGLKHAETRLKILKPKWDIGDVPLAQIRAELRHICCKRMHPISDRACAWIVPSRPRGRCDPLDLSTALSKSNQLAASFVFPHGQVRAHVHALTMRPASRRSHNDHGSETYFVRSGLTAPERSCICGRYTAENRVLGLAGRRPRSLPPRGSRTSNTVEATRAPGGRAIAWQGGCWSLTPRGTLR